MTETSHTRSRRASLAGLMLQLVAGLGLMALILPSQSLSVFHLTWFVLGGVPIWIATLLVFRQRELAELETLDLDALQREKKATGGGAAIFGSEGGMGFRVAGARLQWMQKWLLPTFGLITAIYQAGVGYYLWHKLSKTGWKVGDDIWPGYDNEALAMVVLAVVMILMFLFSRYYTGMARVKEWELLRAPGSYMFGCAVLCAAVVIAFGVQLYAHIPTWEQTLAWAIPVVMMVLALEIAINLVADFYRPRTAGEAPRAAFDSRMLALIATPDRFAQNIAEALNYQFGFQVSQTWFYRLLQRWFFPLLTGGVVALWLTTGLVLVQPYQRAVIEHWGRQVNADQPLGPGLHFKLPWPMERARLFNTGQLQQIVIGFKTFDAPPDEDHGSSVMLWTDDKHMGQAHFNFIITPGAKRPEQATTAPAAAEAPSESAGGEDSVHIIRMAVVVQYRIRADGLAAYTQSLIDPEQALRNIAWAEVTRFVSSKPVDALLGEDLGNYSDELFQRITARMKELNTGLDIVYVGLANIHPEKAVSEAFRNVVNATLEKTRAVRDAIVTQNERLVQVAGNTNTALALADALNQSTTADQELSNANQALRDVNPAQLQPLDQQLDKLAPLVDRQVETAWRLRLAERAATQANQDYELGMGITLASRTTAGAAEETARKDATAGRAAVDAALEPLRKEFGARLGTERIDAALRRFVGQRSIVFWNARLEEQLRTLGGEAARVIASAQALRWGREMAVAGDLARIQNENEAFVRAPRVYKLLKYLEVLSEGMDRTRKYFLAFDPTGRSIDLRLNMEEEPQPGLDSSPARAPASN